MQGFSTYTLPPDSLSDEALWYAGTSLLPLVYPHRRCVFTVTDQSYVLHNRNTKPLGGLLAKGIFISTHVQTQPSVWVHGEPDLGYNN